MADATGAVAALPTARPGELRRGLLVLVAAAVILAGVAVVPSILGRAERYDPSSAATRRFEEQTGIRLLHVSIAGGGGFVLVRYQVLDAGRAVAALGEVGHPVLVDESTERSLDEPWMGHAHSRPTTAVTSYSLLENVDHVIRPSSSVTVVIGDVRLEHVPVW